MPGFTASKRLKKTGWWASDTAELSYDNVRVPLQNRLGDEGSGFVSVMQTFVGEETVSCLFSVTLQPRSRFGKLWPMFVNELHSADPWLTFKFVSHKLAEMATRQRQRVRLIAHYEPRTPWREARRWGGNGEELAAQVALDVTYSAVQLFGGMGYMRETKVERLSRDARLLPSAAAPMKL